uniref:Uncharacterized protein n=1 Tax=Anguilla anguilla TaxID=7936 RepID=A0A0E9SUL8_ANGAN
MEIYCSCESRKSCCRFVTHTHSHTELSTLYTYHSWSIQFMWATCIPVYHTHVGTVQNE